MLVNEHVAIIAFDHHGEVVESPHVSFDLHPVDQEHRQGHIVPAQLVEEGILEVELPSGHFVTPSVCRRTKSVALHFDGRGNSPAACCNTAAKSCSCVIRPTSSQITPSSRRNQVNWRRAKWRVSRFSCRTASSQGSSPSKKRVKWR